MENQSVAFLFAHVLKMPRSRSDLVGIVKLRKQVATIKAFVAGNRLPPVSFHYDVTTYRNGSFVDSQAFDAAVEQAKRSGRPLLIADIMALLERTNPSVLDRTMRRLDGLDVEVLDCVRSRLWSKTREQERVAVKNSAVAMQIGSAVTKKPREPHASTAQNALLGAEANRRRADLTASSLREIINTLQASLPPGSKLTPTMVMHHLNTAGIKAAKWSYNACKDLLKRLSQDEHSLPDEPGCENSK